MGKRVMVALLGILSLGIGSVHGITYYETGFEQADAVGPFNLGDVEGQGNPAWATGFFGGGGVQTENSGAVVDTQVLDGSQSLNLFSDNLIEGETSRVALSAGNAAPWIEFAFYIEDAFAGKNSSFRILSGEGIPGEPQGVLVEFQSEGNNVVANGTVVGQFAVDTWHTISLGMDKIPHYSGDYDVYLDGGFAGSASFNATFADHLRGMVFSARVSEWSPGNNWFVDGIRVADDRIYEAEAIRTWAVDAGGNWGTGTNWSGGPGPDGNETGALFGDAITAARTVFSDAAVTTNGIQFDNANTYAISGTGSVNLEAAAGNATLDVDQGDHEFQIRVNLNSNTDADIAAGAKLSFVHVLTLNGNTLTKTGDGTMSINSTLNTGGGSVLGLGGTITGDGAIGGDLANSAATVAPGNSPGTLTITGDFSQGALGTLAIELAGTASGEFDVLEVLGSAALGGSLDITELYTPGGADSWTILTAAGGITGSFDTITAGYEVSLANGDTELVLSLGGALLPGDANGDGCVDDLDLTALAVHWQQSTNLWENGDFNGDGIVDDLDLTALAVNWQQGCGGGGSFAAALAATNVPEPATVLIMVLGFAGAAYRRNRK